MSYRGDTVTQCDGKVPYGSGAEAARARKQITQRAGGKSNVYRCPHCSAWHIGHERKRVKHGKA